VPVEELDTVAEFDTVTVAKVDGAGELEAQLIRPALGPPLAQSMIKPIPRHTPWSWGQTATARRWALKNPVQSGRQPKVEPDGGALTVDDAVTELDGFELGSSGVPLLV